MVSARVPVEIVEQVDAWAASNAVTRSTAIGRLVELGLTVKQPRKATVKSGARAAELAAKVIDSRADSAASPIERDERKRRLLKGPSAFREIRKDRQK
jgi:hypothetical protein